MNELVDFKSNFSSLKVMAIWIVLLLVLLSVWLFFLPHWEKVAAILAVLLNLGVFAIFLYLKIPLKIIINPQEQVIEYYWMRLWGGKRQTNININNAYFTLDIQKYRGNDLWNLSIVDNTDLNNKISLMEISDGFTGQQLKSMYKVLNQVVAD